VDFEKALDRVDWVKNVRDTEKLACQLERQKIIARSVNET
jgi:hypothetical protein